MNALAPLPAAALPVTLQIEAEVAKAFARASKSASTIRGYRIDAAIFRAWCGARGLCPLPASPETIATFLACEAFPDAAERIAAAMAGAGSKTVAEIIEGAITSDAATGAAISTISRRVSAIRFEHRAAGFSELPTNSELVRATMAGIRRAVGPKRPRRRKAPATVDRLRTMVSEIRTDKLGGLRDRALVLLGFAMAARRSELVALRVEDLEESAEGLRITIRVSKTDQDGQGQLVAVPRGGALCPVEAVRVWREAAGIQSGPLVACEKLTTC